MLSHLIDDADDHRPNRGFGEVENLPGRVAFVENQNSLTGTGSDRVDSDRVAALFDLASCIEKIADQETPRLQRRVVDGGHNRPDDPTDLQNVSPRGATSSTMPTMAWSTGTKVSWAGQRRLSAGYVVHQLVGTGHRNPIRGHNRLTHLLLLLVERLDDQKPDTLEAVYLGRGDNGTDDSSQLHDFARLWSQDSGEYPRVRGTNSGLESRFSSISAWSCGITTRAIN